MGQLLLSFAKSGATYPKLRQIRGRFPQQMGRMSAADGAFPPHQSTGVGASDVHVKCGRGTL